VGCTQPMAVEKCCDQHPKCPACNTGELPKHGPNYRCTATTCGVDECCTPTCGSTLNKPCGDISGHVWRGDRTATSPCAGTGTAGACNPLEALTYCCEVPEAVPPGPSKMEYCSIYGDPHIRTFDNQDQIPMVADNAAYRRGTFWLVHHEKVKIQGEFKGGHGASTMAGLAMEVDGIKVEVHLPIIKVQQKSRSLDECSGQDVCVAFSNDHVTILRTKNLKALELNAWQQWGHTHIDQGQGGGHKAYFIRFPRFKDEGADRSYVEVYVSGATGILEAAVFMMRATDFEARSESPSISGLCGNNNGVALDDKAWQDKAISEVSAGDSLFTEASQWNDWPAVSHCTGADRTTALGLCESCLDSDMDADLRATHVKECVEDRCAGEPARLVQVDCDFINDLELTVR